MHIYKYIYTHVHVCRYMHTVRRALELYSSQDPSRIRTCRPQLLHPRHLPRSSEASILLAEQLRQSLELPQCPICCLSYSSASVVDRTRVLRIPMIEKNKRAKEERKSFDFSFRVPWNYSESYLLIQEDLPQVSEICV